MAVDSKSVDVLLKLQQVSSGHWLHRNSGAVCFVLFCLGWQLILGSRPSFLDVFAPLEIFALLTLVCPILLLLSKLLVYLSFLHSQARRCFLFPIQLLLIL